MTDYQYSSTGNPNYMPPVVPPQQPVAYDAQQQPVAYVPQPGYVVQPTVQPQVQVQPQIYVDPNAQQYAQPQDYPKPGEVPVPGNENLAIDYMMRRGFILKTYGLLLVQLTITLCFISLSFFDSVRYYFVFNSEFINTHLVLIVIACVGMIVIGCMISCSRTLGRTVPINYILLGLFTLCMSYLLFLTCCSYTTQSVLLALGLTIAATVGLTVYAWTTKTDFTYCGGILFSLVFILFIAGIFSIFWWDYRLYLFYDCLGVVVYSIYLIYDTQLIVGEMGRKYQIDDYVLAVLNLYIDIVQLFLKILYIVGKARS